MEQSKSNVIVLGNGRTGKAVSEFLSRRGADLTVFDDVDDSIVSSAILCRSYDYAVISPGIPSTHPAVVTLKANGVPILSELDLSYIHSSTKRIFAISGTNGKTTTCTILHALLSTVGKAHLVGNIGVPWIGRVDDIEKGDFVIVETSSFQIEQSEVYRPYIAALTNVGEDHLDRHLTAETYQKIKLSLLDKAEIKVINKGDPIQKIVSEAISYSDVDPSADFYMCSRAIYHRGKKYRLPIISRGAAFDLDYLCAFSVASTAVGVRKRFLKIYEQVGVPSYRFEYIGQLAGASVYNDSKGTNIDATLFAVSECDRPLALILGGSDKGEEYGRLFAKLGSNVERIYLTGENIAKIFASAGSFADKCRIVNDLRAAVKDFVHDPLPILLFSPASASFDRYKNYEERGRDFNAIFQEFGGVRNDSSR